MITCAALIGVTLFLIFGPKLVALSEDGDDWLTGTPDPTPCSLALVST